MLFSLGNTGGIFFDDSKKLHSVLYVSSWWIWSIRVCSHVACFFRLLMWFIWINVKAAIWNLVRPHKRTETLKRRVSVGFQMNSGAVQMKYEHNMDQRHVNKPKTGICDPKKDRLVNHNLGSTIEMPIWTLSVSGPKETSEQNYRHELSILQFQIF